MNDITQIAGIWLPESETHLTPYLLGSAKKTGGRGSYQLGTLATFVQQYVPHNRRRRVLDVGGHVGLWSMHLSKNFEHVEAFEPTPILQRCFVQNVLVHPTEARTNVTLHKVALSDQEGTVSISYEVDNSGHTHVAPTDESKHVVGATYVEARMVTLDSFGFTEVDALKIDVEGFELAVIRGGEKTIREQKPIICIEQKPHGFYEWGQYDALKLLMSWGAKPVQRVVDDYILTWE